MKYLFTFEEDSHLNIEKTTNRLEGLFKKLKHKLSTHNRLIKNKKSWWLLGEIINTNTLVY
jgi:putative uncharacterized protein (fragment)